MDENIMTKKEKIKALFIELEDKFNCEEIKEEQYLYLLHKIYAICELLKIDLK